MEKEKDGDGSCGTLVFMMTLSRRFSFCDKAQPLGEIVWAKLQLDMLKHLFP